MDKLIEEITQLSEDIIKLKKQSDDLEDYYDNKHTRTDDPEYLLNSQEYANQSLAYQRVLDLITIKIGENK